MLFKLIGFHLLLGLAYMVTQMICVVQIVGKNQWKWCERL